jgi:serine phosphatase RsbU (regulator of sigma subunit)
VSERTRRPSPSPVAVAGGGNVEQVRQRIAALTRLSGDLANARSERELATRLGDGLRTLLDARQIGLYVRSPSTGHLVPAPGTPGDALLRMICSVAPGVPDSMRRVPGGPHLIEHLQSPLRVKADGVRGPLLGAPLLDPRGSGLLAVEGEPAVGEYQVDELETFVGIAAQATLALSRLRAERSGAEHAASPHDLEQASAVQRRILPTLPPMVSGFRVAVEYSPAYHVGGDFYDVVTVGPRTLTALIGDVAGKGVSAALLMSRLHVEFRRCCDAGKSPRELLGHLNEELCRLLPDDSFATAACLRLDARGRTLTVANAGHVAPVVRRRTGGVVAVGKNAGAALGMLPGETYQDQTFPLDPGDIVLLMTDGVVEAVERDPRNMWKLMDLVAQAPADVSAISQQIMSAVMEALGSRRVDDVTLLALMPVDDGMTPFRGVPSIPG